MFKIKDSENKRNVVNVLDINISNYNVASVGNSGSERTSTFR